MVRSHIDPGGVRQLRLRRLIKLETLGIAAETGSTAWRPARQVISQETCMNRIVRGVAKSIMILIAVQWLSAVNSAAADAPGRRGYVLITVQSDMSGTLPLKPDSFWSYPVFAPFTPNTTYLFKVKPGAYSFGGIVSGMKLGWSTFNQVPFIVKADAVTYVGMHKFMRASSSTYSWTIEDALEQSLAGLKASSRQSIEGLPIEKTIPAKLPAPK
jgi:hypothetical protein